MEEIRTNVLPVVDQGKFLGLIRDELIFDLNDPAKLISEVELVNSECWVYSDKHIYDVLRVGAEQHSNLGGRS